jgi:hypothetical protein
MPQNRDDCRNFIALPYKFNFDQLIQDLDKEYIRYKHLVTIAYPNYGPIFSVDNFKIDSNGRFLNA